jgi:hypothetical protein
MQQSRLSRIVVGRRPPPEDGRLGILLWMRSIVFVRSLPFTVVIVVLLIAAYHLYPIAALIVVVYSAYFLSLNRDIQRERRKQSDR